MSEKLYTIEQIAEILQVGDSTVRRMIADREIEAIKVGRQWRITETALQDYLKRNTRR